MPPEAIAAARKGKHAQGDVFKVGPPADVWSLGCILYAMVYGKTPFQDLNLMQKLQSIVSPDYKIPFPAHHNSDVRDTLQRCLTRDPKARPTIAQLLTHPFLNPSTVQAGAVSSSAAAAGAFVPVLNVETLAAALREVHQQQPASTPNTMARLILARLEARRLGSSAILSGQLQVAPPPPQLLLPPVPSFDVENIDLQQQQPAAQKPKLSVRSTPTVTTETPRRVVQQPATASTQERVLFTATSEGNKRYKLGAVPVGAGSNLAPPPPAPALQVFADTPDENGSVPTKQAVVFTLGGQVG
jgi:serine/threonine protein kinase